MPDATVIDAVRKPMGSYRGGLSRVRPDDLAAHAIASAVERAGIDPASVADVYMATNFLVAPIASRAHAEP